MGPLGPVNPPRSVKTPKLLPSQPTMCRAVPVGVPTVKSPAAVTAPEKTRMAVAVWAALHCCVVGLYAPRCCRWRC